MPIKKKGLGKGLDSLIPDNKSIKSVTPDKSAEAKKEAEEKAGVLIRCWYRFSESTMRWRD